MEETHRRPEGGWGWKSLIGVETLAAPIPCWGFRRSESPNTELDLPLTHNSSEISNDVLLRKNCLRMSDGYEKNIFVKADNVNLIWVAWVDYRCLRPFYENLFSSPSSPYNGPCPH
jgi:hypothetical protein